MAYTGRRDRDAISEEMRAALNAFLYNTGTETSKFMLVLATNQPQLLDSAVVDRVDSSVLFDLPVRRQMQPQSFTSFYYFLRARSLYL